MADPKTVNEMNTNWIKPKDEKNMLKNVNDVKIHYFGMKQVLQDVMVEWQDYWYIVKPKEGDTTSKPSLYKWWAEKIRMLFGWEVNFEKTEEETNYEKDYYAVTYKCTIMHDDKVMWRCEWHVSTFEDKYHFRTEYIKTPERAKLSEEEKKTRESSKRWKQRKIVMTNKVSQKNTIMKMAQKRAFVWATLMAYWASQLFTQDVEDMYIPKAQVVEAQEIKKEEIIESNWMTTETKEKLVWFIQAAKTVAWRTDDELLRAMKHYYGKDKNWIDDLTESDWLDMIKKLDTMVQSANNVVEGE